MSRSGEGAATRPIEGSTAELEALYRARADSARMGFADADVDFMTGMVVHHAQALVMSRLAPSHGAGSSVQTLAARIINAQKDEIATMQRWLRDRGLPVPEVQIAGTSLTVHMVDEADRAAQDPDRAAPGGGDVVHGADHPMHMPGMLTPDQMRELDRARGPEFDRLFLTYMIQHHGGAVSMVHDLFGTDGAAQGDLVFKLASDIHVDQTTEIARMERMLSALPAEGDAS